jgi:putative transposase
MIRTYKYRLRPNRAQTAALDSLFCQARRLYNAALEQRITAYQESGEGIRYPAQWVHFRDQRNKCPEEYGLLNASSVQQLLRRLDKAFAAFFRRVKAGETPGFPRYKGDHRFKSVEYRYGDGCKLREKDNGQKRFYLQHVGEIKLIFHRPIPERAVIKHVVVKRVNDKWYLCLMLELPDQEQKPQQKGSPIEIGPIGIDMGLRSLLATSEGELIDNPRWLRGSLSRLRVAQRRVSRRKQGSNRRRKAVRQVARLHEQIANQRHDYWHKLTRELAERHALIAIEDLNLKFLNTNRHLALSSHDAGLGMFTQMLAYKVEETGCRLVVVNPARTSQRCSRCGERVEKRLSVRVHDCPECGLVLDRDVNAARNVLASAFSSLGRSDQDLTWAAAPSVS